MTLLIFKGTRAQQGILYTDDKRGLESHTQPKHLSREDISQGYKCLRAT